MHLRDGHLCHLRCLAVSTYLGTPLVCWLELEKCGVSRRPWRAAGPRCGAPTRSWTKRTAPSRRSRPELQHGCSRSVSRQRQAQGLRNRRRQPWQQLEWQWRQHHRLMLPYNSLAPSTPVRRSGCFDQHDWSASVGARTCVSAVLVAASTTVHSDVVHEQVVTARQTVKR